MIILSNFIEGYLVVWKVTCGVLNVEKTCIKKSIFWIFNKNILIYMKKNCNVNYGYF